MRALPDEEAEGLRDRYNPGEKQEEKGPTDGPASDAQQDLSVLRHPEASLRGAGQIPAEIWQPAAVEPDLPVMVRACVEGDVGGEGRDTKRWPR